MEPSGSGGGSSNVIDPSAMLAGPTNRNIVRLALRHRCLAGAHVAQAQMEALSSLEDCTHTSQFLILFGKLNGNKFRGLYAVQSKKFGGIGALKIYGSGPSKIKDNMVSKYYRYNSGQKSFVELRGAKSTTSTTCAVSLLPGCYTVGRSGSSGNGGEKSGSGGIPKWVEDDEYR